MYATVLVILAGALGFGGYLLKKVRDKRKGSAPKLQSVFFKVPPILSALSIVAPILGCSAFAHVA